jgi:hypothetical protein
VQLNVEHLVARRLAVDQKEVDPLAPEVAGIKRGGDLLGGAEHAGAGLVGQLR